MCPVTPSPPLSSLRTTPVSVTRPWPSLVQRRTAQFGLPSVFGRPPHVEMRVFPGPVQAPVFGQFGSPPGSKLAAGVKVALVTGAPYEPKGQSQIGRAHG